MGWQRVSGREVSGVCILGLVFFGCDGPLPGSDADPEVVVAPEAIHVLGTSEAVARIEDVMPAADGAAWVLNSTEPFLVLLSAAGDAVRTLGVSGGGPGEFSWPTTLVEDRASERLWAYDPGHGRLIRVPEDGTDVRESSPMELATRELRLNSYEYLWMNNGGRTWIEATPPGVVFARATPGLPWIFSLWSTEVTRVDPEGGVEVVLATDEVVGSPEARYGDGQRFLPYPIWTACPDGSLALYDPIQNTLRRFSPDGEPTGIHALPDERNVRMSADRVFGTVYPGVLRNRIMVNLPEPSVLREAIERDYEDRITEFAQVFPEYVHLECAPGNTLWLQLFDTTQGQMGRGPAWLRIPLDGEVGRVRFPETFRPMRFREDRVWGVHTGEFDVEYVAWTAHASG